MPGTVINNILQGEISRAGVASSRFIINSTVGILGFFDPASNLGLTSENEDFGQTLAVWGVPQGPYLIIPFLGPSSPRDFTGMLSTSLIDPTYQVGSSSNKRAFRALDYDAAVRSFYNQSRESHSMSNIETFDSNENDIFDDFQDFELNETYVGPDIKIEYNND